MASLGWLDRWLHRHEPGRRDRVAVATSPGEGSAGLTYGQLDATSAELAARLASVGVAPGDRVVLLCEPGIEWISSFLGALRRGAVVVPIDPRITVGEVAALARRSAPVAALVSARLEAHWDRAVTGSGPVVPVVAAGTRADSAGGDGQAGNAGSGAGDLDRSPQAVAVLIWTSGTTGEPKGVMLSLANVSYVVDEALRSQAIEADDRWLSVLPPNHLLELCCGLLPALAAGSTTFVARTLLPAELVALIGRLAVTRMVVVPMVLQTLRRHLEAEERRRPHQRGSRTGRDALAGVRAFYCGGAPLDADTERFFHERGIGVFAGYGLSEAAPTVAMNRPGQSRPGSVGRPLAGTEVSIAADGEILVRGPGVMVGYWNDEAATEAAIDRAGWLHTGDLGHRDADGFLFVTGRSKSMIVLDSGKKVQPEEVEAVLTASGRFAEVCVVGWRDPHGRPGEQVGAVVVPVGPLDEEVAAEEVRRLTQGLSAFKRPTLVRVHPGPLPATAKASVRRAEVVRLLEGREASEARLTATGP